MLRARVLHVGPHIALLLALTACASAGHRVSIIPALHQAYSPTTSARTVVPYLGDPSADISAWTTYNRPIDLTTPRECDAAAFKSAESSRSTGGGIQALGGIAGIVGTIMLITYDGETGSGLVLPVVLAGGGLVVELVGAGMKSTTVSQATWDAAIASIKVGETKMTDVVQCMGHPQATTSSGDVETVTYTAKKMSGSVHEVIITAKGGIVTDVTRKAQAGT